MRYRLTLLALLALLTPAPCLAAKVKVWHQNTPSDYEKARFKQSVVNSEGVVQLARQLKPLVGLDASRVWSVVEDRQHNLYIATGDDGKLYRLTPEGKLAVVYDSDESEILCLAAGTDGAIYAGTGPGGLIVRLAPGENAKVIYRTPETYVWSIAVDTSGQAVYAGTGPKGRIYRVTPDGKGTLFYSTKQEHVLSLAAGPDDMLYAGTDKHGLVYRIDPKGKAFVVYHAPQAEIRTLVVAQDGIYAGTSSPSRRRTPGSTASIDRSDSTSSPPTFPSSMNRDNTKTASDDTLSESSSSKLHDLEHSHGSSSIPPPGSGENSLYHIGFDGTVREVFREKALLLSQLRQGERVFVGTGMEGQLFEVDLRTKEHSEIARLDHSQIQCLLRRADGSIVVGTGDPAKLYVLQDRYTATGSVVSEILDAKMISHWGSLRWKAQTPAGTSISFSARSGNVAEPDDTWSDWSAEQSDAERATVGAPPARFLQYRATLTTTDPAVTPKLESVAVRYVNTNQAPEVGSVDVPDMDTVNLENPKKIRFRWSATDANEDELTYNLFIRKEGWKNWVQLEEGLDKKDYDWDTTTVPSGIYRLKVVASDRKDNSEEEALTGERVSVPFVVAHVPPTVTIKVAGMDGDCAVLEATATDPLVRLTAGSFAVNGKQWTNVFPSDGIFDSKTESFRFKTEALKSGSFVVVLRVTDAAGNIGSGDVVFTVHAQTARR
jgi:hypothetical protein